MVLEHQKPIQLFSMVFGKTMDSEKAFMEDLRLSSLSEVNTLEDSDHIIAFVPIVSRAGTDIEAALNKIPESRSVVLVVLHHTFNEYFVAPDSRCCIDRENVFTVDCLFFEDRGLLKCQRNYEALRAVKKHLGVDEDQTMDDNITSDETPILAEQYPLWNWTSVRRPQCQTCSKRTLISSAVVLFVLLILALAAFFYVVCTLGPI